jgi:membrane-bound ClpP family serine protease
MNFDPLRETTGSKLDNALGAVERLVPRQFLRFLRWVRNPRARKVRLVLGVTLLGAGVLGPLLPVVGVWMLPLGLLLIAQDVPWLQEPAAELVFWLERQGMKIRARLRR